MNSNGEPVRKYFGNGDEKSPSIAFASETDTGIYLETPGTSSGLSVSKRGTKRLRLDDDDCTIYGDLSVTGTISGGGILCNLFSLS